MPYRSLDSERVLETLMRLTQRIEERFPGAGLAGVARELQALGTRAARDAVTLGRPYWPLRIAGGVLIALLLTGVATALWSLWPGVAPVGGFVDAVQAIESAVNDAVFLGIAVFFVASLERRHKRRVALRALHELRSIAHVVDMHQLTKDPERIASTQPDTASSPARQMSPELLGRYLDYCSELLSITGKIAALYAQDFDDHVALQAVNEVESLATGLSRKIWQKIAILDYQAPRSRRVLA